MRELHRIGIDLYEIRTLRRSLTHRICNYGEIRGFWKVKSIILKDNGVFYVEVSTSEDDAKKACKHLDLKLK